jgi:acyl-CoA synthetase (AMP-forming)/AMP-acid ligase II
MQTLVETVKQRALAEADKVAVTFLADGDGQELQLTYGELDRRARKVAAILQALGDPGDRAILLYPPGLDLIVALFACFYAGLVAVPAYPPSLTSLGRSLPRLRAILKDSSPQFALTLSSFVTAGQQALSADGEFNELQWVPTDSIADGAEHGFAEHPAEPDGLVFLQYTSGSTKQPRGVMLTHSCLAHNLDTIRRAFEMTERDCVASWLPPYHDMGLIGCIFTPFYVGSALVLMSPIHFLQRPFSWLKAITRHRATIAGGPNFAYDLCVRKIPPDKRSQLDLKSLQLVFIGAEPVRAATLEAFAAAFGPCGFDPNSFYPCYGLAEATLYVTGGSRGGGFRAHAFGKMEYEQRHAVDASRGQAAVDLVSCGTPGHACEVLIVDPDSREPVSSREVGEVWTSGPSVAAGYWGRPDDPAFQGKLSSTREADGPTFLRTGDLGFFRDGQLFICGRLKDLIIIRGRNHYPEDIEVTVDSSHPRLRRGASAVFSLASTSDEVEQVVVVAELAKRVDDALEIDAILQTIQRAVILSHEIRAHDVVLIAPGTIPKTSSGKIQRSACRAAFLSGELDEVARSSAIRAAAS